MIPLWLQIILGLAGAAIIAASLAIIGGLIYGFWLLRRAQVVLVGGLGIISQLWRSAKNLPSQLRQRQYVLAQLRKLFRR